ncbi:MAG: sensor histidine kinase [Treponema sp.]|jgi:two-component system sensor histidine kinase YesM|nr:sensor histidine kinase [Treponema sp.]
MKPRGLSLFNKFIIAFISVGVVPVLLISFYSGRLFREQSLAVMEDNYRQAALYGQRNIDSLVEKYNTISKMLYTYSPGSGGVLRDAGGLGFANVLKSRGSGGPEELKRRNDIISFLYLVHSSDPYISNVIFIESDGTVYAYGRNNRPLINGDVFLELVSPYREGEPNRLEFIPTHRDSYFLGSYRDVFTLLRNYLDISYPLGVYRVLGTLYIEVDASVLDAVWRPFESYRKAEIFITDREGSQIYGNPVYSAKRENQKGPFLEISSPCTLAPWELVFRIDYQEVMGTTAELLRFINITVTLILTALLVLSVFYSRYFVNPLKALLAGMKKVEEGCFDLGFRIKARDEIGELAAGFYEMTEKLRAYIETSLIARIRQKEAELSSLKARIKPHFLYNSLEIIRMNAIANDDNSTADLVMHLAQQMKASIERRDETVPLSRELDLVRGYFAFVNLRYDHKVLLEIHGDPALENVQVLSLLIQPVAENAVIHGIIPKGAGRVSIRIGAEKDCLRIIVEDDGVGMDDATLKNLTCLLGNEYQAEGGQDDSIGLKNVHDRLRYKFGESYGVSIGSTPGRGSTITLSLPLGPGEAEHV